MTPEQKLWACVIGLALEDARKLADKIAAIELADADTRFDLMLQLRLLQS